MTKISVSSLDRVAVAVVAVAALVAVVAAAATGGEEDRNTLVAYVADASPLESGSSVRAAGVKVGTVKGIRLEGGVARVELDLQNGVLPVHRDASLKIVPVNLLGEHYVELDPGSPDVPYSAADVIPKERTDSSVDLQDVINTFDDPTSTAMAALLTTLGEGMDRNGTAAADAIKGLAPSMNRTRELGEVLSEQNQVLGELVRQSEPVASALAVDDGKTLDGLVTSTDRTLNAIAVNREAFDATLAELPATLATARRTLNELAGVADTTTPTLASVRPVTDNLAEISRELHRFSDSADPALASLPPVLRKANGLLDQAAPVLDRLGKAGPDLRNTAKRLRPIGDELLHAHLGDLMDFVRKWSLSTNGRDALSHYFRGVVHVTPKNLEDFAASLFPAGAAPAAKKPANAVPKPDLGAAGKALPSLPLLGTGTRSDSGATGLTPEQENAMLGQLLGVN